MTDKLTPLQRRILRVLAPLVPSWTLAGGGALAGVHLGHRTTRDLDLFWRSRPDLGDAAVEARARLQATGLHVVVLRTSPMFSELRVSDDEDVCVVDLVVEPFPAIASPHRATVEDTEILVDSKHEILVSKLTALLGRAELRDLVDVRALIEAGGDLHAAVRDAPKKDAGFSAVTLAWVLQTFEIEPLGRALGWSAEQSAGLDVFRRQLIDQLLEVTRPE